MARSGEATFLGNIGNVYKDQGDSVLAKGNKSLALTNLYPKALDNDFKSLNTKRELGDKKGQAEALINIGAVYISLNKLTEADKFLNDALKLATEINALNVIKAANELLSQLFIKKGDWKKAYQHYEQVIAARDSINGEEKSKRQTRLEMNYAFDKKQAAEKS